MSNSMNVVVFSENVSILGSVKDLLSVCVWDCMVGLFTTDSSKT